MLDLLQHDRGHVLVGADIGIIRKSGVDRHAQQLFIAALVVFHHQHAHRPAFDHGPGNNRRARNHQRIERIAILTQGVGHKAIIGGVAHGRVQKAIDKQRSAGLVKLIFHGLATDRHLDQDIQAFRRIIPRRDQINAHADRI